VQGDFDVPKIEIQISEKALVVTISPDEKDISPVGIESSFHRKGKQNVRTSKPPLPDHLIKAG
jgi:hypothetical protein